MYTHMRLYTMRASRDKKHAAFVVIGKLSFACTDEDTRLSMQAVFQIGSAVSLEK